jgi:MFS family permease
MSSMRAMLTLFGALLAATALLNIANGSLFTLIGLRLAGSVEPSTVGIITSGHFIGLLTGSFTATAIIARVGHIRAFTVFAAIASCAVIMLGLFFSPAIWFLIRIVIGYAMAGLFMVLESWFNSQAGNAERGRVFAFYMVASSGAFAVGPFLVNLGDPETYGLFAMTAIILNLCLLPIALTRGGNPVIAQGKRLGLRRLLEISPLGVVGCVAAGLVNSAVYGLGAVYGDLVGLGAGGVSALFSAIILGGLAMQVPVGWISDRFDRRSTLLALTAAATIVSVAVVVLGSWSLALLPVLAFFFGGMTSPVYGLSVAQSNDYVEKEQFVGVSSGLLIAYSLGAIAGPNIASWAMDAVGPAGLWLYAAVILLALGGFTVYRMRRRAPLPVPEQGNYIPPAGETPAGRALDPRAEPLPTESDSAAQRPASAS